MICNDVDRIVLVANSHGMTLYYSIMWIGCYLWGMRCDHMICNDVDTVLVSLKYLPIHLIPIL